MIDPPSLLSKKKLNLLEQINVENKSFFKWFLALTEIPHGSFHCTELSQKIQNWVKHFGFEPEVDSSNNIVVRIPSNIENNETNLPTVGLQAHIDMVLNGDIKIDQPVNVEIKEQDGVKVLISPNSTLGADDGFGVAIMLEIIETSNLFKHGPLELIFTTDEEPMLHGIRSLAPPPYLKFDYLFNLDSLNGNKIFVGCCGGIGVALKYELKCEPVSPDDFAFIRFNLKGLTGGHSGMNIGKGYASSITWVTRILLFLSEKNIPFRFVKIDAGGRLKNLIPTQFDAIIAVPKDMKDHTMDLIHEIHTRIMFEYFKIECTDFFSDNITIQDPQAATVDDSKRFTDFLILLPNGVHRMSPQFPGTVQSSDSISLLYFDQGCLELHFYMRSSCQSQLNLIMDSFYALLRLFGEKYVIKVIDPYPAWEPKLRSKLAKIVQQVYKDKTNEEIELGLLEVGVEPAMFIEKGYKDAEIVSISPSIPLAHAPGEWIGIEEAMKWRDIVHSSIEKLNKC